MNSNGLGGNRRADGIDPTEMLSVYLNDHLAGAAAGTALARRLAKNHRSTDMHSELDQIARQIEQDRGSLRAIMDRLGIQQVWYKAPLALLALGGAHARVAHHTEGAPHLPGRRRRG